MSVLNPAALLLLLIAVPITLLYVLRVRLRRAPISSMMFWQQALADQPPRAFLAAFSTSRQLAAANAAATPARTRCCRFAMEQR